MRIVAIANQKGGTGKTTTAVNLGAVLGELGRRVLLVDLDPQGNATDWIGGRKGEPGAWTLLVDNARVEAVVTTTSLPGVDLIPASPWLFGIERALAGTVGAEMILRRQLRGMAPDRWDYVLIDCPPTLGLLTVGALAAAHRVLAPVEAHVMALAGLAQLLQTVELVRERLNPDLSWSGFLLCRVDARTRHALEVAEKLREYFPDQVFQTVIRENVRLAECFSFKKPITVYDPRASGAEDFRALGQEFLMREEGLR
jgi:chromosome partitioning protein